MHSRLDNKQDFPSPTRIYHNARRACTIEIRDVVYVTQHKQIPFERTSYDATCYAFKFWFPYSCFDGCSQATRNANRRFVIHRTFVHYKIFWLTIPHSMSKITQLELPAVLPSNCETGSSVSIVTTTRTRWPDIRCHLRSRPSLPLIGSRYPMPRVLWVLEASTNEERRSKCIARH